MTARCIVLLVVALAAAGGAAPATGEAQWVVESSEDRMTGKRLHYTIAPSDNTDNAGMLGVRCDSDETEPWVLAVFSHLNLRGSSSSALLKVRWDNHPQTEVRFTTMTGRDALFVTGATAKTFIANMRKMNRFLLQLDQYSRREIHEWDLTGADAAISQLSCVR